MFVYKLLLFLATVCNLHAKVREDCSIPVSSDYERNLPLLLESNNSGSRLDFVIPNGPNVTIRHNGKIYLACPGVKNYLTKTNSLITELTCTNGEWTIAKAQVTANELQCANLIKGSTRPSYQLCGNGAGYAIDIGYELANSFLPLITVCYNDQTGFTYYTKHAIYSDALKYASRSKYRPSFNVAELGSRISASVAYKRPYQKATFNKLLKNASLAERYVSEKSYLSRGHLAPDSDFIFAAWQFTTYFYINTNPQWQAVNGGNWKRLESVIRNHAIRYKNRIVIYTGSHGILQYKDTNNESVDVYMLPNNLMPVPKYFWKILYDPIKQEGITFAILNDPFVTGTAKDHVFCKDICNESNWQRNKYNSTEKGLLFCCDYGEFARVVQTAPKLNVTDIMKYLQK